MISMKDIAKTCGVSIATVSKALNDQKDIGIETKEYIRQVAKELGYSPNAAAKALKTNRSYNIGVLFVDEARSGLTHDYFSHVLDSFKRAVEEQGYDVTFINCNKTRKNRMSYLEHARYRGFDGVMIACIDFSDPEVVELVNSNIPVVTIDYLFPGHLAIFSDNEKGMGDLLQYIYGMGHRKVAYIHGADSAVTRARLDAFYQWAKRLGMTIPDEYVKEGRYLNTKDSYDATLELLDLENPPTCIIYPDDFSSFGGMNAIRQRGLKIPEDVSIAGYDGIRAGRHIEPKLTTIRQNTTEIGEKAAEGLIKRMEQPKTNETEKIVVAGELYEGKTVMHFLQF